MRVRPFALGLLALSLGCESRKGSPRLESTAAASAVPKAADVMAAIDAGAPSGAASALDGPYNVLLITIDSLRADMPWAGYARPIAPRLASLYARSVAFENAYSTSSFTSKSIPGLLTGRLPSELVRTGAFFTRYLSADQFVCKHLGAEGIPCVGGHAHMYFGPNQSGFETGFQSWKIVPGITFDYQKDPYVTSDKLTPLAIGMLTDAGKHAAEPSAKPFFAWFHYMDPHDEYIGHTESPHFGKRLRDLYDEEVFFTDMWIGKLLDFVESQPWSKKTVIFVTADHGEAFGEHGATRHAHEVWEELVHVPLFVYVPGGKPRVISASRGAADLAPTFVELLGAKNVPALPGTSLVAELRGGAPVERDVVVDLPEDEYNERRRAFIHDRKKLIAFGQDVRFALYDLATDPHENNDLIRAEPDLAKDMRARYREASASIKEVPPRGGIPKHDK
jgi:arylsulfatase A-like enzyme